MVTLVIEVEAGDGIMILMLYINDVVAVWWCWNYEWW